MLQVFYPHAVEPALGGSRLLLAVLCDALHEEPVAGGSGEAAVRTVLRLHEDIAPYRAAVRFMPTTSSSHVYRQYSSACAHPIAVS